MTEILYREHVPNAIELARLNVRTEWKNHPDAARFVEDWYPDEWERIQSCRTSYAVWQDMGRPLAHRITPWDACRQVPQCIVCTDKDTTYRTLQALKQFHRVTPNGQPLRLTHMVFTAPLTEDGQGWGGKACRDLDAFALVLRRVLQDVYGPGVGGLMTYHDFGNRPFRKIHPHWDFTLNGYQVIDKGWRQLPKIVLTNAEQARIREIIVRYARHFQVDATPGQLEFGHFREDDAANFPLLWYQLRELVDLTAIEYRRERKLVRWVNYRDQTREAYAAIDYVHGIEAYHRRVFGGLPNRRVLDRYFGHMGQRRITRTQRLVGGQVADHKRGCECHECRDWQRVYDWQTDEPEFQVPSPTLSGLTG